MNFVAPIWDVDGTLADTEKAPRRGLDTAPHARDRSSSRRGMRYARPRNASGASERVGRHSESPAVPSSGKMCPSRARKRPVAQATGKPNA